MYWELLSFYKLFPCTEDFVTVYELFSPVPGTLDFYNFPPVLKTLSFYYFLLVLETWVFYKIYFSMYSGLTNISSCTKTFYFY